MDANFDKQYNDEVGRLVDAFTRMKTSLEIAIKRLNNKGNRSCE
jgi:HAMP domain-containing protein